MRIGDLHIMSEAELQRLYRLHRPANLDEKKVLEGQIDDLHQQLEALQADYDRAIEAGDRAVDKAQRLTVLRRALFAERKTHLEQIELLQQQVRDLTDAVQNPPEKDKDKEKTEDPAQNILDQAQAKIGFGDDLTTGAVQAYIQRELRLRGDDASDRILAEVLAGGLDSDDELEEEEKP